MLGLNGLAPSLEFLASVNQEHLVFILLAIVAVVLEPRFKHMTDRIVCRSPAHRGWRQTARSSRHRRSLTRSP